jgi:hypothetical protein
LAETIELRGLLNLAGLFRERGWDNPHSRKLKASPLSGLELLAELAISDDKVEAIFVNGKAERLREAVVHSGDRVTLVPPGVPGPYRVLLGFVKREE